MGSTKVQNMDFGKSNSNYLVLGALIYIVWFLFPAVAFGVVITDNAAVITWKAPGDDGPYGIASEYDIRYSTNPINEQDWGSADMVQDEPRPQVANSDETYTFTGLLPGRQYYLGVKTRDEANNWSGLSNILVVTMALTDVISPDDIVDLQVETGGRSGELIISWTAPGDDWSIGTADHYIILCSSDTITVDNWQSAEAWNFAPVPAPGGAAQTDTITGLDEAEEYWVAIVTYDESGNESAVSNIQSKESGFGFGLGHDDGLPTTYKLYQNYPNPFNPSTNFDYYVPLESDVRIVVFNVLGQQTAVLVEEYKSTGLYTATWDGTDDYGAKVSSGIYYYRITSKDQSDCKKMVLLK